MRIRIFQHIPFEGPAGIGEWAASKGHPLSYTKFFNGGGPPRLEDVGMLVIMGGPMSVDEEGKYPWLRGEKAFIREAIDAGKPVLGICLGAQLMASALGAKVYRNENKEIGWLPVRLTPEARKIKAFGSLPAELTAFQWHGDTFDLPAGAVRLASSETCANQAFLYREKALALQFHLEATRESVRLLVENCGGELVGGKFIQSAGEMLSADDTVFSRANGQMSKIIEALL